MWVDKLSNNIFTKAQLEKRYDSYIQSKFPLHTERAMNRKTFAQIRGKYNPSASDQLQEVTYELYCKKIQDEYAQAIIDNELLKETITYEKAEQRLSRYLLSEGREGIPEVLESINSDTGELLQGYIPPTKRIKPLQAVIKRATWDKETGEYLGVETIPNPLITKDTEERREAQKIINTAIPEILILTGERISSLQCY